MPNKDHIRAVALVRFQPRAKVIPSDLYSLVRLVPRIYLGMDHMSLGQQLLQQRVNMCGKRPERLVVSVEAMDIDYEEPPFAERCFGGDEGLG